jgi:hypothetical protein
MIKSKYTSINSFWSIFNEPICLDGVEIKKIECDENTMWDLEHIFDGTPDWMPRSIGYKKYYNE